MGNPTESKEFAVGCGVESDPLVGIHFYDVVVFVDESDGYHTVEFIGCGGYTETDVEGFAGGDVDCCKVYSEAFTGSAPKVAVVVPNVGV